MGTGKCTTCAHFVRPPKAEVKRGLCLKYIERTAGPRISPMQSCRRWQEREAVIDHSYLLYVAERAIDDLDDARKLLAACNKKMSHVMKKLRRE